MSTIRVDGNDIWAVYNVTSNAKKIALEVWGEGEKPMHAIHI